MSTHILGKYIDSRISGYCHCLLYGAYEPLPAECYTGIVPVLMNNSIFELFLQRIEEFDMPRPPGKLT